MLYLLFGAYSFVFEEGRGFSAGIEGLTFIGLWLGMVVGIGEFLQPESTMGDAESGLNSAQRFRQPTLPARLEKERRTSPTRSTTANNVSG